MNYIRIYSQIVEKRRQSPINKEKGVFGKVEYHHIIPIACNGDPTPRKKAYNQFGTNLVGLTPKEHFIVHHLLTKIYHGTPYARKMMDAFNMMAIMRTDKVTGQQNRIRITSVIYEKLRKHAAEQMSLKMMGREPANKGKPSPLKGLPGRKWTEEQKQKAKIRGRKFSAETRRKLSEKRKGRKVWNKGLKMSDDFKRKCSEAHKRISLNHETVKGRKYITNGLVIRLIKPFEPLPAGFHYGRK